MEHSDKNEASPETNSTSKESEEIDRIMQQIEDLEKRMESTTSPSASAETSEAAPVMSSENAGEEMSSNVIALNRDSVESDSLVESDAVPPQDQPLLSDKHYSSSSGHLGLKVGGCTEVTLEFEREGVVVTLTCNDDGLSISTDQGAEFRLPFKKVA